MEVTILSRELNEESAKKFYEVTENMLEQLAHSQGIDDLSEYYELTDFKIGAYGELLKNYGDCISGVFMQMAFHAQNASRLDTIVKFLDNLDFLRDKLCDFDPKRFLERYKDAQQVIEALRYNENTEEGLVWNSEKSQEKK